MSQNHVDAPCVEAQAFFQISFKGYWSVTNNDELSLLSRRQRKWE